MAKIIDGTSLAREKEKELSLKVKELRGKGVVPRMVSLVMEDDEAGLAYTGLKQEVAERVGVELVKVELAELEVEKIIKEIERWNEDDMVQGIMVQRPDKKWREKRGLSKAEFEKWWQEIVGKIEVEKDVDGLNDKSAFCLAAVRAVEMVLEAAGGKKDDWGKIVVVGSQGMVGKALVGYFRSEGLEVEGVETGDNLGEKTLEADWLITATGVPGLIKAEMVKPGAGVIDVGWPKAEVEFEEVKEKAGVITPVPGGIGPLTIVALLENLIEGRYNSKS